MDKSYDVGAQLRYVTHHKDWRHNDSMQRWEAEGIQIRSTRSRIKNVLWHFCDAAGIKEMSDSIYVEDKVIDLPKLANEVRMLEIYEDSQKHFSVS